MQRRWKADDFGEAGIRLNAGVVRARLGDDRLTSRTSRSRFFAVPVTGGGGVLVRRTRPGRSLLERSPFAFTSLCCVELVCVDLRGIELTSFRLTKELAVLPQFQALRGSMHPIPSGAGTREQQ